MASHRKTRPGGTHGAGVHTPSPAALATATLASVAVLPQPTPAAPAGDGGPSPEEIEKKIDEFYRRPDSAPEGEAAALQRPRSGEPHGEGARRAGRRTKARDGLGPFATTQDSATALLAEYPQDHFAQNLVMNRLASRVRDAADRGKATRSPETPTASHYDVKTAKADVQHKLATARELLGRLVAREHGPTAAAGQRGREDPAPRGRASSVSQATRADRAVVFARAQIGKPYVSGASGPGSYDCSGLTQAAWKAAGVTLPRGAREQAAAGTPVSPDDARAGDLVFFHDDCSHVGLCTGNGSMIHAPKPGTYVCEESLDHGGESTVHHVVRPA
ncbi:glycoside hydrolase [Streptomyces pluripotens]|uniref:Glycoside hydrolase n=1 Tax=Streptomyces pluripotens TaxID=1355015 RepID=A0A221P228_9ACTN|nr:C40 family peptidase [Streptomyces pluripotens]ARP71890.1 hypothetical protein LK06_020210 [Streptomyces pluripotens]ASN26136.1 glycoside hydrolase [Streptomyces pluripotens]